MSSDNVVSKHQLLLITFIIYLWYAESVRNFILKPVLLKKLCLKTFFLDICNKVVLFGMSCEKKTSIGTIWGRLRASALEWKWAFSFSKLVCACVLKRCRIQNHGEGQTKPHDCAIQHWIRFAGIVVHDISNTKFMGLISRKRKNWLKTKKATYSTVQKLGVNICSRVIRNKCILIKSLWNWFKGRVKK